MTRVSGLQDGPPEESRDDGRPEVRVLLVEGRAGTASVVRTLLGASAAARFSVLRTATIDAGVKAVSFGGLDVVVLGTEVLLEDPSLERLLQGAADLPVIALTGSDDPRVATTLIDGGLHDCVPASRISADALGWAVLRAVHRQRSSRRAFAPTAPPVAAVNGSALSAPEGATTGLAKRFVTDAQTPVTALVGLVTFLISSWDTLGNDQKLTTLSNIGAYATSVERLTADLLTMASLDADVTRPVPRSVALASAIVDALSADTAHDVTVKVDPSLVVWADPGHLARIVNMLVAHAAPRATAPLVVSAAARAASVRLSVTGSGAPRRDAAYRWSLLHADSHGVGSDEGVGLAVAQGLAEANGGIAGVDDVAGSVWARLPSSPPDLHLS